MKTSALIKTLIVTMALTVGMAAKAGTYSSAESGYTKYDRITGDELKILINDTSN